MIKLLDLKPHHCKWPIGDPKEPDFAYCGVTRRAGSPYCPHHFSIAFTDSRAGISKAKTAEEFFAHIGRKVA